jgi:integrase
VSNQRLLRRGGVYYYRRRVPAHLVKSVGKHVVQASLHTTNAKEAKRLRTLRDLEWDARFEAADAANEDVCLGSGPTEPPSPIAKAELLELVRNYVERQDQQAADRHTASPPITRHEQREMTIESEFEAQTLRARGNEQADQWIYLAGQNVLKPAGKSFDDPNVPGELLAELVRRGLLELSRRQQARLADNHGRVFFDRLFDPDRRPTVTFGELAKQWLSVTEEEATINGLGAKGLDRQRATLALIREIIGDRTPVDSVDYDTCLRVRSMLAQLPANRTKLYGDLPLESAIQAAVKDSKPLLSPVTQQQYLAVLRDVLDLAAKKRLIVVNFAEGLKPIKRDTVAPGDKRRPFTLQQIINWFNRTFYAACANHNPPFAHDKAGWRFWLPLMCLFTGMRPNEAAQMHADDLKRTAKGTWYLDIVATGDDDESPPGGDAKKTLKTAASRRRIPLHPELIKIGFPQFVEQRKAADSTRLFPELKADKYGNFAWYALKRFNEVYLPKAIKMEPRQAFYSFRHSFRDALRRSDAPPEALQALGGWSQGSLTSSNYGDKSDPDYQMKFVEKISFPGLVLTSLYSSIQVSNPPTP